jgi:hypothetical protein
LLSSWLLLRRIFAVVVEVIVEVEVAFDVAIELAPLKEERVEGLGGTAEVGVVGVVGVVARTGFRAERLLASKLDSETLRSLDAWSDDDDAPGSGVTDFP